MRAFPGCANFSAYVDGAVPLEFAGDVDHWNTSHSRRHENAAYRSLAASLRIRYHWVPRHMLYKLKIQPALEPAIPRGICFNSAFDYSCT